MFHSNPHSRTRAVENVSVLRPKNLMATADLIIKSEYSIIKIRAFG